MAIPVKLKVFEGPLDLMLRLLYKDKIDIYEIPVAEVAGQYTKYICGAGEEELDIMSEFLLSAATLLDIKCRALLPKEAEDKGDEEEQEDEAARRLLQYKMYKKMASELKGLEANAARSLFRPPSIPEEVAGYVNPPDLDVLLDGMTAGRLEEIFREVMTRREDRTDPVHSKFGRITKEKIPFGLKLSYIENYAKSHKTFSFRRLLKNQPDKMQVVVTFLAILELIKRGALSANQDEICGDIMIESLI